MRRACLLVVAYLLLVPGLGHAQSETDPPDKTLAPYFFVDGDPELDKLPLKSTDVNVDIAGVIADVKVTQRYKNEGTTRDRGAVRVPRLDPCRGLRHADACRRPRDRGRDPREAAGAGASTRRPSRKARPPRCSSSIAPMCSRCSVANILPGRRHRGASCATPSCWSPPRATTSSSIRRWSGRATGSADSGSARRRSVRWQRRYLRAGEVPSTRVRPAGDAELRHRRSRTRSSPPSHELDVRYDSHDAVPSSGWRTTGKRRPTTATSSSLPARRRRDRSRA